MFSLENICSGLGIVTTILMFYFLYHYGCYEIRIQEEAGRSKDAPDSCGNGCMVTIKGNKELERLRKKASDSIDLLLLFVVATMASLLVKIYGRSHIDFWAFFSAILAGFALYGILYFNFKRKL